MSPVEIAGLIASAAAAGVINAVAGGGTLVTFPTLLLFGTAARVANATSSTAPFLLLFATILFLCQGLLRRLAAPREGVPGAGLLWGGILFQLGVAVYGGYF